MVVLDLEGGPDTREHSEVLMLSQDGIWVQGPLISFRESPCLHLSQWGLEDTVSKHNLAWSLQTAVKDEVKREELRIPEGRDN